MEPVCTVVNASKAYGKRVVADHVSFEIFPREMVALLGASGSGKSTILNMIGGLESLDGGSILVCGKPVAKPSSPRVRRALRYDVGYLFQNFALMDNETVEANLKVAQRYSPKNSREDRIRALEDVGLRGFENRKVFELSGGEQQRVSLARLFLKPCELILADEPTGSLDHVNRDRVMRHLRHLADQGKGVLIVTHDAEVAAMCDRSVRLSRDAPLP